MKKVFFALFAVVIAVGGSAFTNANVATGTIYGSTTGDYTQRSTIVYDNQDCEDLTNKVCAYQVTSAGENIVTASSYTAAQMLQFVLDGHAVQAPGARKGLYNPN